MSDLDELMLLDSTIKQYERENFIDTLFPDTGKLSRDAYKHHMPFFMAGKTHWIRLILASNQTGKSLDSSYELSCHLTGIYPKWWNGKVLTRARNWLIVGETSDLLRRSLILTLLGPLGAYGTGMIRKSSLDLDTIKAVQRTNTSPGSFRVKHVSGEFCNVDFGTYEQPRESFQAVRANILFDEEPPLDIWSECMMRTATLGVDKLMIVNFTPLKGETVLLKQLVQGKLYQTGAISEDVHLTQLTWDDAPHLDEDTKRSLLDNTPVYLRDARSKGIPVVGEGAIYPCKEENLFIDPIRIPDHWKRDFALDFGWNDPTAITWYATDPDSGISYQYAEHYLSESPVSMHAAAIWDRNELAGFEIPGVCDPSGGGKSIASGEQTRKQYEEQYRIKLISAENALRGGHGIVYQKIIDGKFKVFNTCVNTKAEWRTYAIKKGKPSGADHAMDTWRYHWLSGVHIAKSMVDIEKERETIELREYQEISPHFGEDSWMLQ